MGALRAAWAGFVGRGDFAPFCEQPEAQESTLVVVERAELLEAGDLLVLRLAASHFLWKMVRRLVGTAVAVGTGQLSPTELAALRAGSTLRPDHRGTLRTAATWTAPPSGLFLERVVYPGDPPLGPLRPAFPI